MNKDRKMPFLLLICASVFNILLAYIFGNDGYEVFITISIALGLLITWQSIQLLRINFASNNWLVIKAIYALILCSFWFIIIAGVMLSVSRDAYDPNVVVPSINWLVVCFGVLPYMLPRLLYGTKMSFTQSVVGFVTTLYSVLVLFVAMLGFYNSTTRFGSILLVLAIQLQYLMNHLAVKTNYIEKSHVRATKWAIKLKIANSDAGKYFIVLSVGLPFIVPLLVVLAVSAIK